MPSSAVSNRSHFAIELRHSRHRATLVELPPELTTDEFNTLSTSDLAATLSAETLEPAQCLCARAVPLEIQFLKERKINALATGMLPVSTEEETPLSLHFPSIRQR